MKNSLESIELFSFDIFDTLITRKVGTPSGIFLLMQNFLMNSNLSSFIKTNFYNIRIDAEDIVRRQKYELYKIKEVTFDDIYHFIQENYFLTNDEIRYLKDLEIETEIKNAVLIEKNVGFLKDLILKNKRVILVSDMYFSSQELRLILSKLDRIFKNIPIYVSSEYKKSKANGELYKEIKAVEKIEYSKWHHIGDNRLSDIKRAKEFGISTEYFSFPTLMPYEKSLLKELSDLSSQIIVGSARVARLNNNCEINREKYDFGASFGGPILYDYVNFVINQAIKKGFRTLYFVARDGYIPKIIADIIISKKNLNIKTKYLYGSRLAWRVFSHSNFYNLIDVFFSEYKSRLSIEFLAYRFGMNANELGELVGVKNVRKKLSHSWCKKILQLIKNNQKIVNKILESTNQQKELLLAYMEQEIDFSEKNLAFVDLHGTGRTQDCLSHILNEKQDCILHTFYLTTYYAQQLEKSFKYTYTKSIPWDLIIELLSKSFDGQTVGYKRIGESIHPVTEKGNGEILINWGLNEYIEGINQYVLNRLNTELVNDLEINNTENFKKVIGYIDKNLDKDTANIMGAIPYKTIGDESIVTYAAPKISLGKAINSFVWGKNLDRITSFNVISRARSGRLSRKCQEFIEKYSTLQKFLFNIYIHKKEKRACLCLFGIKISLNKLFWRKYA